MGWVGIAREIQYSLPPPPPPHISPHTPILFTLKLMHFSRKGKPYRNLLGKGLSANYLDIRTPEKVLKFGVGAAQCIVRRRWLKQGCHCCSTSSFTFPFFFSLSRISIWIEIMTKLCLLTLISAKNCTPNIFFLLYVGLETAGQDPCVL